MAVKQTGLANEAGYRTFKLGNYTFARDEYFTHIEWPGGSHMLPADRFLKALMRDVAWNFFYGIVNFDEVFGTANHYGTVDVFAGSYNASYRASGKDHVETFDSETARGVLQAMLEDWTNEGFDPFAAPSETGDAFGPKRGNNDAAVRRQRVAAKRMAGAVGDIPLRADANGYPVNRQFADVEQDAPEVHAEPGFEQELHAFNFFAYLSRSDVTWNPSVCSVVKDSLFCPTTEEYMLPVIHGNDRVEWFIQLSDEIHWEVADRDTGEMRARVVMKAGDWRQCRQTYAIRGCRRGDLCCWCGRMPIRRCRNYMRARNSSLTQSISSIGAPSSGIEKVTDIRDLFVSRFLFRMRRC